MRARRRRDVLIVATLLVLAPTGVGASSANETESTELICEQRAAEPIEGMPWQQDRVDAERAWPQATGRGVLVAVIDTGVDAGVPQLEGHVLPGADIVNSGGDAAIDCDGHGTFVAGIVAAQPAPDVGFVGVAPDAVILPVRQANDTSDGTAGSMADAIVYAVDNDASILNISATAALDSEVLQDAIAYATANDVLIIASVSNEAENGNPVSYPAAYEQVVAVGSINVAGEHSDFSGTIDDIDLVAPGEDVVSVVAGTVGHAQITGTSFAAPFVTGVAALVRERHPHLTAEQVRHRLRVTADHPGPDRPTAELGYGVVNPYRAVNAVLPEEHLTPAVEAAGVIEMPPPAPALDTSDQERSQRFVLAALLSGGTLFGGVALLQACQRARRRRDTAASTG